MGIKICELPEGSPITLNIRNNEKTMQMNAVVKKHIKEDISLITLDYDTTRKLVFENVAISVKYSKEGEIPIIWNNVKVVNYKTDYVLQTTTDGMRTNRRNSFRVGVSKLATNRMNDGPRQVMVKDVSLSGFAIADRRQELNLQIGDFFNISLDDMGCMLNLNGKVVRIEEHPDVTVYGLEICNLCKDLSAYVSLKQRKMKT